MAMPTLPSLGSPWGSWGQAVDEWSRSQSWAATVFHYGGDTIARHQDGSVIAQGASGSTNDADIINAAIDAVATGTTGTYRGGGAVMLADSQFIINEPIVQKIGVGLLGNGSYLDDKNGNGMSGCVLQAASGYAGNILEAGIAASGSRVATNPHHAMFMGIGINGLGTAAAGVRVNDTRMYRMRNFVVRGCTTGIHNTSTLPPDNGSLSHEYRDFFIDDCPTGILTDGTAGGTDGQITDGRILSASKSIRLLNGGGWQIHGLHMTHSSGDPEHMELVTNKAFITNCYFDSGSGPVLNASSTSWLMATGNHFQMTGAGNYHVFIGTKANISNNVFEWTGAANPRSMIGLDASSAIGIFNNNWGGPVGAAYIGPVTTASGMVLDSTTTRLIENNMTY